MIKICVMFSGPHRTHSTLTKKVQIGMIRKWRNQKGDESFLDTMSDAGMLCLLTDQNVASL